MSKLYNQRYFTRTSSVPLKPDVAMSTIEEIIRLTRGVLKSEPKKWIVLDVGCGIGDYAIVLSEFVKKVVGVEPYSKVFKIAKKRAKGIKIIELYNSKIENYKTSQKFDLAISLTTLEHMPKAEESFKQVFKLLKPGGVLYLTAPNKLWPLEPHHRLLFLNWLPLGLANIYLKFTRGIASFENSAYARTYFGLKHLLSKYNCSYKFIVPDLNYEYIGCGEKRSDTYNLLKIIGIELIRRFPFFWIFSKGFIVLAVKNEKL